MSIAAPAEEVWRRLAQIAPRRGGMYGCDRLENLFGLDIPSTDEIHEERQHLAGGDRVALVAPGRMGLRQGYSLPVARVDAGRAWCCGRPRPSATGMRCGRSWSCPGGPGACRLMSHDRAARKAGTAGRLQALGTSLMKPVTALMTRRMLLGIKDRAEASLPRRWEGIEGEDSTGARRP
ncbi:MAG: SRPBCC family protein [Actinomycetota bacterium]